MTDENSNPVNKQVGENLHLYQPSQIIKLPDWDYPGGEYRFELVITSKATGAQYEYYYPSYDGQSNERIYVDSTEASQEFGLAAVQRFVWYDPLKINKNSTTYFGPTINTADTEKIPSEYLGDGVITRIPAGDFTEDLYLDFSINDMPVTSQGYYGTKAIKVWNETDGVNAEESKQRSEWRLITNSMNINLYSVRYTAKLVDNASEVTANIGSNTIPLVKDTDNKLGVQVINDNGRISGVRYIRIYPAAQGIQGTISYIPNTAEYVKEGLLQFTPEPGQIMENVSIYARDMVEDTITDITGNYNASENTYSLVLDKPGNHGYYLYAIDGDGNYTNLSKDGYWQWIYTDPGAPDVIDAEITNLPNGKYEATYVFSEDTIVDSKSQTLSLYFDDEYMNELGFDSNSNDAFTVSLPVNKYAGKQTAYEISDSNPYGIYKVETEPVEGQGKQIRVTVYGVSKYNDSIPEGDIVPHTLYAALTDPFGYESEPGAGVVIEAENTRPKLLKGGFSFYGSSMNNYNWGFIADFNTPVKLDRSISAKEPSGYSEKKNAEIPIFDEGSYTISFYDVFGIEWIQDITVTAPKEFRPYGFKILVSETDYTKGPVTVSITAKDMTIFWVYDSTDGRWDMIDEDMFPTTEATFEVNDNMDLTLVLRHNNEDKHVKLYITNICKDAPQATVKWYFHEFMSNNPEGITETSGPVTATYETNVPTVPYGGTVKSYTFYPGNPITSYTFEFMDPAGNVGSTTADLEAMGISLVAPSEPVQDNTSPEYDIYVYRMTENAYESLGLYEGSDTTVTLDDVLEKAGYAKGYKLLLHITDPSPCRIILLADKNADTQNITYNSESEPVDGVALSGNLLTVTRAVGFKVVIVDSCNNQTSFTVDLGKYLDNTPPEAALTKVVKDPYTVIQYINLTDKSDNGDDTGIVKLMSPVLYKVDDVISPFYGQYYYEFTVNKSFDITFCDSAGNIAVETVSVDDLDMGWPDDTVEWYPCGINEETGESDPTTPPVRKTAKDVMAAVKYSKPISTVSASISLDDGESWTPVKDISDAGNYIEVVNTSDAATVIFKRGGFQVRLIAETPNGISVYTYLSLGDVIDKTPPQVKQEVVYSYNTGYESGVPIAATIILTPQSEDVYCASLPGKLIRKGESVSFNVSKKGNYTYSFSDEVGNATIVTVTVDRDMDRTPPEIVITKPDSSTVTGGLVPVTISVNEPGKLKVNGVDYTFDADITSTQKTVQIQIGNNGSYEVTVVDDAGNKATAVFTVGNIDKTAPSIALSPSTVNIRQDSSSEELDALLASGWSVYDNISPSSAITLDYDPTVVNLTRPGVYTVEYTALDEAGNQGFAKRFVRVYSKNEIEVLVNGLKTYRDETTIVESKTLSVTVNNPLADEPYTVYLGRGINSEGQMKSNYIIIKPGQSFTVDSKGFYTLYIVTQSRQTYMTKIYVEE